MYTSNISMPLQFFIYEGETGDYTVKNGAGMLFQFLNLLDAMRFVHRQSAGDEVMVSCFSAGGNLLFEKLIGNEDGRCRLRSVSDFDATDSGTAKIPRP
jgi:hypothetical protein